MLTNVCGRLQQNGIDIGEFSLFVVALFPPGDCIPQTNDLHRMFRAITQNGLWDFWNYSPLEEIVQRFGKDDPQLLLWINEYKCDLVGFKACTKMITYLSDVKSSDTEQPAPVNAAKYDHKYYHELSVKLKLNVANRSLSFIDDLWRSVSECFLLPPLSALFDRVHKGCITVVWLIPTSLVPRLLRQIYKARVFLKQRHIASLALDNLCVYNEESNTVEQKQSPVVSSHISMNQSLQVGLLLRIFNSHLKVIVFLCCSHQGPQELLQACKQGNMEVVLRSLAADVDVDIKDTVRLVFVVSNKVVCFALQ